MGPYPLAGAAGRPIAGQARAGSVAHRVSPYIQMGVIQRILDGQSRRRVRTCRRAFGASPTIHMNSTALLTGSHLRTYNALFQQPVSPTLGWSDVRALFRHLGQVEEAADGRLKVTRNGEVLELLAPRMKDVAAADEIVALRHFLERSSRCPGGMKETGANWLLIIDHREARIYRSAAPGAVAQQIRPRAPEIAGRNGRATKEPGRGREKADPNGLFEPVAAVLNGAGRILIFGSGSGRSSEMEQFTAWLLQHRPEVAQRIIGSMVFKEDYLTEAQLLARARDFFGNFPAA